MNNKNFEGGGFVARHTIKSKESPEGYDGISQEGVKLAQEKARQELMEIVENAPEGAIVFLGGASEQVRTKSTAKAFGEELAELNEDNEDVMVITKEDIEAMYSKTGENTNAIKKVKELITNNPDKKIVIDYPMQMKEFSFNYSAPDSNSAGRWTNQEGVLLEYWPAIMEKHNSDHGAAAADWIETGGKTTLEDGSVIEGPSPQATAEEHIKGVNRLHSFAERLADGRPVTVGVVAHGFEITALLTYLANEGIVDKTGLDKVLGDGEVKPADVMNVEITDDKAVLKFNGEEFDIDLEKE